MRIAVIGSGVSGLASALIMDKAADVDVFEKDTRIGGHSNTVDVETEYGTIPVDTGFIVFNPKRYPNLIGMLDYLNVPSEASDMSFALSLDRGRIEYEGSAKGLFGQPSNLLRPSYWQMVSDLMRFYRQGMAAVHAGAADETLADFIARMRFSNAFVNYHLLPLGAAIWSCPADTMLQFPARSFMAFMENHQLLDFTGRPRWRTVSGGSRQYVQRILSLLKKPVRTGVHITGLRRQAGGVMLSIAGEGDVWYDRVVMAAHADQSLAMISDATDAERDILGAFDFQPNMAILHSDIRQMPKRRRLWASWNYRTGRTETGHAEKRHAEKGKTYDQSVTYWMNKLQNIQADQPMFVTLNPIDPIAEDKCHAQISYDHPVFDQKAMTAQNKLPRVQGQNGLYFCGAWTGYGFHEDGMASAVKVAKAMGFDIPWPSPTEADFDDMPFMHPTEVPAQ